MTDSYPEDHAARGAAGPAAAAGADAADGVVTVQPAGAYGFMEPLVSSRVELLLTLVIDGILLVLAVLARAGFMWILHLLPDAVLAAWPIVILEFILDFGLVGTAGVITLFDLAKRIRNAYRDFNA